MKTIFCFLTISVLFYSFSVNAQKESISQGTVSSGKLINGARIPFKGKNHRYFMRFSYSILKRAYVHSQIKKVVVDSYEECESFCPGTRFILMECSRKKGGKMPPHRTHQNGTSIDFASPLLKKGKPYSGNSIFNLHGYGRDFTNQGSYVKNDKLSIDFETMAKHLYILDKHCRKNGLKIEKVIFNTDLQKKLFETEYGKKIKGKMYFVKALTPLLNKHHDEHYHVDFTLL